MRMLPSGYSAGSCEPATRPRQNCLHAERRPRRATAATYTLVAEKASLRPLFDDPLRGSTIVTCPGTLSRPGPWRCNAAPQHVSGTLVCSYGLAAVTWTTEPTCSSATSMPIELGRRSTSSTSGGRRTPDVLRPGPPRRLSAPTRRTPRRRSSQGRSPRLSPAPQCKSCWRLCCETKVRNAKLSGLNEISRSSSLCSWPDYSPRSSALADIGDIRTTDNRAAAIHVRGKGGKERSVPIEAELLFVIEAYLDSRAIRFPAGTKRKAGDSTSALSRWPARSPLFVGRDGERITRGTLQSRIKRSFNRAGPEAQPVPGASFTGFGIPTRLNWPAPTSAYTHL